MHPTADHLIRAYFESLGKLTSPAALTITGMPAATSTADHLHTKHGDLLLAMRGLSDKQMFVLGMRFAGTSGTRPYLRYVRSVDEMQSHEAPTGRTHPDDATLNEVTGSYTLGATVQQMAERLQVTGSEARRLLASARYHVQTQGKALGMIA